MLYLYQLFLCYSRTNVGAPTLEAHCPLSPNVDQMREARPTASLDPEALFVLISILEGEGLLWSIGYHPEEAYSLQT